MRTIAILFTTALGIGAPAAAAPSTPGDSAGAAQGIAWASWRGPQQDGTSLETGLPDRWTVGGENQRWTYELAGRGTPVVAGGRVYALGYDGQGPGLQEVLVCLDEATGRRIWEHRFNDFLSDTVYDRYAIGAPAIDPETGNVYCLTTPGLFTCFSPDGEELWQHSMMEEFGRLTFPNGRTGAPVIDHDLAITRGITSSWGPLGPARDRFYAFDKKSGDLVWISTPGTEPEDNSFALPVLAWRGGERVLYTGTGCGNIVAVNARTAPLWRFPMSLGGINSSVLLAGDRLIAIHGRENFDASQLGRMIAIELGARPAPGTPGPVVLDRTSEVWRNDLDAFSSSPVLVGDRVYQTVTTGELCCVDATSGAVLWQEKLGTDQLHASPVYGDGKLYVPMTNGSFYIIEPSDSGARILSQTQLGGNCLAAPAIASGRVYVHSTERLYCFGREGGATPAPAIPTPMPAPIAPGLAADEAGAILCTPAELLLAPGDRTELAAWSIDAGGDSARALLRPGTRPGAEPITWTVTPPLELSVRDDGTVQADSAARTAAGVIKFGIGAADGAVRVRILPDVPFTEDFEAIPLANTSEADGVPFGFPPGPWLSARLKWEVRDLDGDKVLAKTLDRALFQRAMSFIGHPDASDYTAQVDIMSDGNRRTMSTAGIINQRYMILLKGNHQEIEISSNQERVKESVPFPWRPKVWYTLKSRVDLDDDGSALVRAKAWPRDEPEPDAWNIELTHANGHTHGAPGLFGFAPQSRFRVYVDNIRVTPND